MVKTNFRCDICIEDFDTNPDLWQHLISKTHSANIAKKNEDLDNDLETTCSICKEDFVTKPDLRHVTKKLDLEYDSGEEDLGKPGIKKNYSCKSCNENFDPESNLWEQLMLKNNSAKKAENHTELRPL